MSARARLPGDPGSAGLPRLAGPGRASPETPAGRPPPDPRRWPRALPARRRSHSRGRRPRSGRVSLPGPPGGGRPHGTCSGSPTPFRPRPVPERRAAVELSSSWVPADADVGFVGGPAGLGARRLFCWFRSENVRGPAPLPRVFPCSPVESACFRGLGRDVRLGDAAAPSGPSGPRTAADRRPSARRAPTWASRFSLCRAPGECTASRTPCRACPGRRCCGTAPRREGWAAGRPGAARVLAQSAGGARGDAFTERGGNVGPDVGRRAVWPSTRVLIGRGGPVGPKRASALTGRNQDAHAGRGLAAHKGGAVGALGFPAARSSVTESHSEPDGYLLTALNAT